MKLSKAIEIQSDSAYAGMTTFDQDFRDSQKLGIEAMKGIRSCRQYPECPFNELLPGETED